MEFKKISENVKFTDEAVAKVTLVATEQIALDVYYFKPAQILGYHRHPEGDQIFTVISGTGTFFLETDGVEEKVAVEAGDVFFAPKNVWHNLVDGGKGDLVAQQVTKQPAGMEKR